MQVEAEARKDGRFGAAAAADAAIALEHRDLESGACQIGGGGHTFMAGADDNAVEIHAALPDRRFTSVLSGQATAREPVEQRALAPKKCPGRLDRGSVAEQESGRTTFGLDSTNRRNGQQ